MKNLKELVGGVAVLALSLCFVACSDDDEPSYSTASVTNSELKTILTQKGYQFNEKGNLLLDDKANQTTQLDLSGTNISVDALAELSILPNLTDVDLSDNGYTKSFDFSKLPQQITGVDLTGNELYEYPGLLNIVTQENGDEDVTVLRNLTKLYLPESAKYNCDEIPTYFAKVSGVDMKMANASGTLEAYTTLREVPDEGFRTLLKESFSTLFNGDNIDISKRLIDLTERNRSIVTTNQEGIIVNDIEGFQYILNNKGYAGNFVSLSPKDTTEIKYFNVPSTINQISLTNVSTPNGIDLSKATNLNYLTISKNPTIDKVDLSASTTFGQRGDDVEFGTYPSYLKLLSCDKLKNVFFGV